MEHSDDIGKGRRRSSALANMVTQVAPPEQSNNPLSAQTPLTSIYTTPQAHVNKFEKYRKKIERQRRQSLQSSTSDKNEDDPVNILTNVPPTLNESDANISPILREEKGTDAISAHATVDSVTKTSMTSEETAKLSARDEIKKFSKPTLLDDDDDIAIRPGLWQSLFGCCIPILNEINTRVQKVKMPRVITTRKDRGAKADPMRASAHNSTILATNVTTEEANTTGVISGQGPPTDGTAPQLMVPLGKGIMRPPPNKPNAAPRYLLKPALTEDLSKKCLVLDLDETLVHSSFKPIPNPDFIVPVEIDNQIHYVYVLKRPYVDEFMRRMGLHFEIVLFTASLAKYADPVIDSLDKTKVIRHRLFREACFNHRGNFVKDLSQLGRDLRKVIIVDNSPISYMFHPTNAVPITTWFNDPNDAELLDLIPFLEDLRFVDNVMTVLDSSAANEEEEDEEEVGHVHTRRRRR